LVAQAFDTDTLQLVGEPYVVADPVSRIGSNGRMNVAVSATGLLLYSDSNTLSQFTWFDTAGKPLGVVGEPDDNGPFRLSNDGRLVAVSRDRPGGSDLWLLEVERGVSKRFTNSGSNLYPVWSPDGRTIVYRSGTSRNLFRKESSGAASKQRLTESPNNQVATDWSRDGRFVVYHESRPATQRDLWILPLTSDGRPAADAQPRRYLGTPFNESWGRFSPETSPRWVAYQSDESGRYEVYIQAFPEPSGARQISTGGGQYPQWSAGGRELFYVSPDSKLMAVSLKLGADSVQPSAPRELFPLPANEIGGSPYDATPDGQRFLVSATPPPASLTVIVNWPALLKKKATTQ
jgi:eukaryotic-like serine/threonine-protein kinase